MENIALFVNQDYDELVVDMQASDLLLLNHFTLLDEIFSRHVDAVVLKKQNFDLAISESHSKSLTIRIVEQALQTAIRAKCILSNYDLLRSSLGFVILLCQK